MFVKSRIKEWCDKVDGEWNENDRTCRIATQDPAYPDGTVEVNEFGDDVEVYAGGALEIVERSWDDPHQENYEEREANSWKSYGHGDVTASITDGNALEIQEHEQHTRVAEVRLKQ